MKSGNLIILTPGLRQVWQVRFTQISVYALIAALSAAVGMVSVLSYTFPPPVDEMKSQRLAAENRQRLLENKDLEFQVRRLSARAVVLEEMTSRISLEAREQLRPTAPTVLSKPSRSVVSQHE
jgi:hypothetical protein